MEEQIELLIEIVRWRGVERILIVLGGFVSVVLGGLLYRWGVFDKIKAEIEAGNVGKFSLQDASPGAVFCLFGVILLIFGVTRSVSVQTWDGKPVESVITQKLDSDAAFGTGISIQFSQQQAQSLRTFLETTLAGDNPGETEWTNIKDQAKTHLQVMQKN